MANLISKEIFVKKGRFSAKERIYPSKLLTVRL